MANSSMEALTAATYTPLEVCVDRLLLELPQVPSNLSRKGRATRRMQKAISHQVWTKLRKPIGFPL